MNIHEQKYPWFLAMQSRGSYWPGPIWASICKWSCSNPITGYFPGVWKYGQFTSGHIGHTNTLMIVKHQSILLKKCPLDVKHQSILLKYCPLDDTHQSILLKYCSLDAWLCCFNCYLFLCSVCRSKAHYRVCVVFIALTCRL
jgi:hypothetical protein